MVKPYSFSICVQCVWLLYISSRIALPLSSNPCRCYLQRGPPNVVRWLPMAHCIAAEVQLGGYDPATTVGEMWYTPCCKFPSN
jgi:hypothetical protein